MRAKLTTKGVGRWADSAGDRAKFGLTTSEMIEVVDRLAERNMLDCLQLLHFHIGSQISSIIPIKNAMQEASNIYVELAKLGCKMGYIDVGGGLAVDYDGSKTDFHASKNYQLEEYAADVVSHVQAACVKADVPVPTIVSESGRAVAAHHSVLVFEVVGANEVRFGEPVEPKPESHRLLQELFDTYCGIQPKNVQESYHDASQAKEEAQSLFKYGYLGLRERAQVGAPVLELLREDPPHAAAPALRARGAAAPRAEHVRHLLLQLLGVSVGAGHLGHRSAVPDHAHPSPRAKSRRCRRKLADLTCDSDGMIDHFIDVEDVKGSLDLHRFDENEPYYLGMFLNGAYQEILGDLHNLFGDTNAVHVALSDEGYQIRHVIKGDSVTDVLRYVEYVPENMIEAVRRQAERATSAGRLTNEQMRTLMQHYEESLRSYTYLTGDD